MMKKAVSAVLLLAVVMLMAEVHGSAAAPPSCTPTALLPCLGAITAGSAPPTACCTNLKAQQPCFCQYIANPAYKQYVDSPNARKVAGTCNVTIPTSC